MSERDRARHRAYNRSEKGRARYQRYNRSAKGRAGQVAYRASGRKAEADAHRRRLGVPISVFEEIGRSPIEGPAFRKVEGGSLAGR